MKNDEPDLAIIHANQLVTMDSKFGVPRIGEKMGELAIILDGAVAVKDDKREKLLLKN